MNTTGHVSPNERQRLLIEEWLPIAEIGIESLRERTPMTPFPAPNRLHVWFARRPLVASRAAVLASLLPADADRKQFLHTLGIHGDPLEGKLRIAEANRTGERLGADAYGYKRAFTHSPEPSDWSSKLSQASVLDPTAGGGSIPFEALRLGCQVVANDLNPVAWLILKATVDFPALGPKLLARYKQVGALFTERCKTKIRDLFPSEPHGVCDGYLWARTIACPYCSGKVPLSPMWNLTKTTGVRLIPILDKKNRHCQFEVVDSLAKMSKGTVKGGIATCPFPDCGERIDGDHIKAQAQSGLMGQQLYAVVYKEEKKVGVTKNGKPKLKKVRGFRAPRFEDDVEALVAKRLAEKMPEWQARNIVPDEERYIGPADRSALYGILQQTDMFSPRQLFGHCTSVEVFHDLVAELEAKNDGKLEELDRAALVYVCLALDKLLNYNGLGSRWHPKREVVISRFERHDFSLKWTFSEMAPVVTGLGYDWALKQTGKSLQELVGFVGCSRQRELTPSSRSESEIACGSADSLSLAEKSVDCIVIDPPYYDNVMYAELADFFYVWLKRTAGLFYPEIFASHLTDKDREATANAARFKGEKGAKEKAGVDYQQRMAAIFKECRRVLKSGGVMTLMFTHKANGAWDALTKSLVEAGFVITASWPINTEAEGSLHIKDKSAAKSTIFLVCRVRAADSGEARYWEDIEPEVAAAVRRRIKSFQDSGIAGVDLYLACFGPALEVFSEAWPLTRGEPRQTPAAKKGKRTKALAEFDAFAVTPEDALDAARREVKDWRIKQLARTNRHHHLDPITEWFILAWDAFRAPRFPADEAIKLARVVGLDLDRDLKNIVCNVKGNDVTLKSSTSRKLRKWSPDCLIDALHSAAYVAQTQNVGAAKELLAQHELLENPALRTALEALLNVLPASAISGKKADDALSSAASDFEALEKLRRLAFVEYIPAPQLAQQLSFDSGREMQP